MEFRPVEVDEEVALRFTFGEWMGRKLTKHIKIKEEEGESDKSYEVFLFKNYSSVFLYDLGKFIYGATFAWQGLVGRYFDREGGGSYNYKQLYELAEVEDRKHGLLNLNSKEHARAVRDWFWVAYGSMQGLIGADGGLSIEWLWERIIPVLGVNWDHRDRFGKGDLGGQEAALVNIADNHYACMIKDLRDYSY